MGARVCSSSSTSTVVHASAQPLAAAPPARAQVIQRSNATEYGLASAVWASSLDHVQALTRGIKAGTVWVRAWAGIARVGAPRIGECRQSGGTGSGNLRLMARAQSATRRASDHAWGVRPPARCALSPLSPRPPAAPLPPPPSIQLACAASSAAPWAPTHPRPHRSTLTTSWTPPCLLGATSTAGLAASTALRCCTTTPRWLRACHGGGGGTSRRADTHTRTRTHARADQVGLRASAQEARARQLAHVSARCSAPPLPHTRQRGSALPVRLRLPIFVDSMQAK